jgi:hypothetical protein
MTTTSAVTKSNSQFVLEPSRGVVGMTDDILAICRIDGLRLIWQDGRCQYSSAVNEWKNSTDLAIRKSVFRAILTRIAFLCNVQSAGSVSPYGGESDLLVGDPSDLLRVIFVNTASEQMLTIARKT